MLGLNELENAARLKRISLKNAEKDYLQELILFSLYSHIGRELVFKGGTCLYKIYKLNRFSEDLDFTLVKNIQFENILPKLIKDIGLLNIGVMLKEFKSYKNEINVRLLFNGPLYRGTKESQCFIPLNISLKEKVLAEPKRELIASLYREIASFEVIAMDEKEILAEKARAVMTRDKPRDVYDLWFLASIKKLKLDVHMVNKKLKLYGLKFNPNSFIKALDAKKGLWDLDLKSLVNYDLPEFNKVREEIIKLL